MDVPGMGQDQYKTFDELSLLPRGGDSGHHDAAHPRHRGGLHRGRSREACGGFGITLQLTNILRDVGEDLSEAAPPQDELARFGLTEDDLFACEVTPI